MRDVHDRGRLGTRAAVPVDERGAHRAEQALARNDASLARVGGLHPPAPEKDDAGDGGPSAEHVFDGRLAEDEVGVARVERDGAGASARGRRVVREPCDELADRALELEPHVDLARLARVRTASASLLDPEG